MSSVCTILIAAEEVLQDMGECVCVAEAAQSSRAGVVCVCVCVSLTMGT